MKKHLSLILVVLLLLSITAFATPATNIYMSYDFPDENTDFEQWRDKSGDIAVNGNFQNKSSLDLDAQRTAGKKILVGGTYWMYGKNHSTPNTFFVKNPNGNNTIHSYSTTTQHDIIFVADTSWDGSVNTDETYVVSYDLTYLASAPGAQNVLPNGTKHASSSVVNYPGTTGNMYDIISVYGLNSTGTTYDRVSQIGYKPYTLVPCTTNGNIASETFTSVFGDFKFGNAYRFAAGYKYDSTKGQLLETLAVDGGLWKANDADNIKVKAIDAFTTSLGANSPMVAKIRMYTIDDAVPFAVSAVDAGTVSPLTKKLTFKFNRPIVALKENQVSMKVGTEDFTKFKLGEVKMVESGTEIYSTVEVLFDSILDEGATFSLIIDENVTDEIGNKIGSTNNKVEFLTGAYPVFESEISASGMESGDDLSSIENKNTTFAASFKNTDASAVDAVIFVGVYSVGTDGVEDTADDKLIGYSFAKTNIASGATHSVGFGTKVESGTYVKAFSFGSLENYSSGVDFNSTNVGIN